MSDRMNALRWARTMAGRAAEDAASERMRSHRVYVGFMSCAGPTASRDASRAALEANVAHLDYAFALRLWCALDTLVREEEAR